jgi:hypothetical protein
MSSNLDELEGIVAHQEQLWDIREAMFEGREREVRRLAEDDEEWRRLMDHHDRLWDIQSSMVAAANGQRERRGPRGRIPTRSEKQIKEGSRGGLYYEYGEGKRKYIKPHQVIKCGMGSLDGAKGVCAPDRNSERPLFQQTNARGKRYGRVVKMDVEPAAIKSHIEASLGEVHPGFRAKTDVGRKIVLDRYISREYRPEAERLFRDS